MVYNPDLTASKELITGILIANLTPFQLDTIQEKFGIGANMCNPNASEQLFIHDKRSWSNRSHLAMFRAMPDVAALIVIDARSAADGSAWYIDSQATQEDVDNGDAENTNTLQKLRMNLEDVVISYTNYIIANTSIREDMDEVDIPLPTPEHFDQTEAFTTGFDYIADRYINPTWVTATPDELESSTDPADLDKFSPRPDIVYRLNPEAARDAGVKVSWTFGSEAVDVTMPDGTVLKFPQGSKVLQCEYDPETAVPRYVRPEGSL
ncbi:hypothetical protein HBH70_126220 [Parastagonospora nodorum]|nr:hypothetical protein HBH53_182810 [Parastagonospora nodorum]KAH4159894.1 hypothetical protein HBH43_185800 [Parastagonospora nodorum]KAH4980627.1 hypothetical protein HBI76_182770 [Parastagonospora nodorum]KAH5136016.1 hypothetical protein HBH70_126220 [Parastagonospora nodorum]KAH5150302.1 hypothetical protein HBH69_156000 [Parastagonospora nodorum]